MRFEPPKGEEQLDCSARKKVLGRTTFLNLCRGIAEAEKGLDCAEVSGNKPAILATRLVTWRCRRQKGVFQERKYLIIGRLRR